MDSQKKSKLLKVLCIVLAVLVVIMGTVGGISYAIKGEKVDCAAEVEAYNEAIPAVNVLYTGMSTEVNIQSDLDSLDKMLAALITGLDIESLLYSDEVASLITKYSAILLEKDLSSLKFKAMEKQFPEAYSYIKAQQESGAGWDSITLIPFGVTDGDKEAFLKACGAGAEHLGDALLKIILYEPSSYYKALVPSIEATHTGTMPSITGFVLETGLSGSNRIEFLLGRILEIIEPIKASPLTYLCDIVPDFIINYNKACELLNSNVKITEKAKLSLPTIDSIVSGIVKALGMTAPAVDYDYLASLGTASVGESGGNDGERTVINGNREAVFQYLADYITGLFTYENNYPVVEDILLSKIKNITSADIQNLIYGESVNSILANLLTILARNADTPKDVEAESQSYNSQTKDFSSLFNQIITEETVSSLIDTIDSTLVTELTKIDINSAVFTDKIATVVAKVTAELCGKEFTSISFAALKKSFPEAYNYVSAEQAAGKSWDDIDTIPFGITAGDREMFIKACGAGSEHFGDALALCIMVSPTSYDDGLVPLLEAFHTGPMPVLKDFVASSGLDGAKRMEDITTKVLSVMEPLMESPLSYLCEILPDVVNSYNKMAEFMADDPASTYVGLHLPPINELIGSLVASFELTLPETSLSTFADMATAVTEASGDSCGYRMSLYGDREVVLVSLINYVVELIGVEGNFEKIINVIEGLTDLDLAFIVTIYDTLSKLAQSIK